MKGCYKYGSSVDLSVKKRQRGLVYYMCRGCRRLEYYRFKLSAVRASEVLSKAWSDEWDKMAKDSYVRILKKVEGVWYEQRHGSVFGSDRTDNFYRLNGSPVKETA